MIKRQLNRLTRVELRRLEDWLLAKWDQVEKTCKTLEDVARLASNELKMHITSGNVSGSLDVIGKRLPLQESYRSGGMTGMSRLQAMLIIDLYRLMNQLGVEPVNPEGASRAVATAVDVQNNSDTLKRAATPVADRVVNQATPSNGR